MCVSDDVMWRSYVRATVTMLNACEYERRCLGTMPQVMIPMLNRKETALDNTSNLIQRDTERHPKQRKKPLSLRNRSLANNFANM